MNQLLEFYGLTWDDISKIEFHQVYDDESKEYKITKMEWLCDDRDYALCSSQLFDTPLWDMAKEKYNLEIIAGDEYTILAQRKAK